MQDTEIGEWPQFRPFPKIPRLSRDVVVTEKIDGTNGVLHIPDDGERLFVGKRTTWITPAEDNHGFAQWAYDNWDDLLKLGPGTHYGEWWGQGINKRYGKYMKGKKFSLFNVSRWSDPEVRPKCCDVVPLLYSGVFDTEEVENCVRKLKDFGSVACLGCPNPEGIIVYHTKAGQLFKKTCEKDELHKGEE